MDLSNPSLWQLSYIQSFNSEFIRALNIPIPEFDTPNFEGRITRIKVTNSRARDNWKYAGRCNQIINAGNVSSAVKTYGLELNQDRVIIWEDFSLYNLRIKFPKYFSQATISIFQYTGSQ
jgi:hypothetical protein